MLTKTLTKREKELLAGLERDRELVNEAGDDDEARMEILVKVIGEQRASLSDRDVAFITNYFVKDIKESKEAKVANFLLRNMKAKQFWVGIVVASMFSFANIALVLNSSGVDISVDKVIDLFMKIIAMLGGAM